jgi:outer membrane protein
MKRSSVLTASLVLVSALTAIAQTPASHPAQSPASHQPARPAANTPAPSPSGPAKVAVIAFQAAVSQTNEFQRDFAVVQKKYDPRRTQLKTLSDEIDTLTKQLQAQSATLTDAQRSERAHAIDVKKKQLDRDTQDAQTDFQTDMQEVINRIAAKVGEVMTAYANQHGYTLVIDASPSQQQSPLVLYASESLDITRAVIDAYNEKSGVAAPAAAPAEAPDAPAPATKH